VFSVDLFRQHKLNGYRINNPSHCTPEVFVASHIWKLLAIAAIAGCFSGAVAQFYDASFDYTWYYSQPWDGAANKWGDTTSVSSYVFNSKGKLQVYCVFKKDLNFSPGQWQMYQKIVYT